MELKQGIYNISFEDYLAIDAIDASYLKLLAVVPKKAKIPIKDTPEKAFGRAVHSYILDGTASFFQNYAVIGDINKRTKAGKEEYAEFGEKNKGKEIISYLQFGIIKEMQEAVLSHPYASKLLEKGRSELSFVWQDQETGLWCKGRMDRETVLDTGDPADIDLKTTKSAEKYLFRRDVVYLKYHWSAAFHMEGLGICTGKLYTKFFFIALEKEPPYRTEVYELSDNFLVKGYDECHKYLRKELEYRKSGFWPHYKNPGSDELPMPQYLEGDEDL